MQRKRSTQRPETDRERETRARREAEIVMTRCRLCDATYEGALVDGRTWHADHLRERHPDFEPEKRAPEGKAPRGAGARGRRAA